MDPDQTIDQLRNTNAWLTQRVAELERQRDELAASRDEWARLCGQYKTERDDARREAELVRDDKRRLDEMEAIPFALEIKMIVSMGKSDSASSLRSQIDAFLELARKKASNTDLSGTASASARKTGSVSCG